MTQDTMTTSAPTRTQAISTDLIEQLIKDVRFDTYSLDTGVKNESGLPDYEVFIKIGIATRKDNGSVRLIVDTGMSGIKEIHPLNLREDSGNIALKITMQTLGNSELPGDTLQLSGPVMAQKHYYAFVSTTENGMVEVRFTQMQRQESEIAYVNCDELMTDYASIGKISKKIRQFIDRANNGHRQVNEMSLHSRIKPLIDYHRKTRQ
jgi:hypothetical protein